MKGAACHLLQTACRDSSMVFRLAKTDLDQGSGTGGCAWSVYWSVEIGIDTTFPLSVVYEFSTMTAEYMTVCLDDLQLILWALTNLPVQRLECDTSSTCFTSVFSLKVKQAIHTGPEHTLHYTAAEKVSAQTRFLSFIDIRRGHI